MSGHSPIKEPLILSRNSDYVWRHDKNPNDVSYPTGTTAELVFYDGMDTDANVIAAWDAELVAPSYIQFIVQVAQTNQIPDRTPYQLMVHLPTSASTETQDYPHKTGRVKREN